MNKVACYVRHTNAGVVMYNVSDELAHVVRRPVMMLISLKSSEDSENRKSLSSSHLPSSVISSQCL